MHPSGMEFHPDVDGKHLRALLQVGRAKPTASISPITSSKRQRRESAGAEDVRAKEPQRAGEPQGSPSRSLWLLQHLQHPHHSLVTPTHAMGCRSQPALQQPQESSQHLGTSPAGKERLREPPQDPQARHLRPHPRVYWGRSHLGEGHPRSKSPKPASRGGCSGAGSRGSGRLVQSVLSEKRSSIGWSGKKSKPAPSVKL